MAFCGKCGSPLDGGKFCPQCGAPVELSDKKEMVTTISRSSKKPRFLKKVIIVAAVIVIAIFAIKRFSSIVNEPCDWCGSSPSVAYKVSDGSYSYVCKDCSSECALCGDKATKHYENMLGVMVFVCNDCYKEVAGN